MSAQGTVFLRRLNRLTRELDNVSDVVICCSNESTRCKYVPVLLIESKICYLNLDELYQKLGPQEWKRNGFVKDERQSN